MVINHSVKLPVDLCLTWRYLKNCTLKKPFIAHVLRVKGNLLALKKR